MIRTVRIPRGVSRMGVVQAGDGGSAGVYQFDRTGLSQDARLAYYLQDLTPAQLQNALDGKDATPEIIRLLNEEQTGTGAGWLPCGSAESGDPFCNGGQPEGGSGFLNGLLNNGVPTWAWVAGAGALALLLIPRR